MMFEKSAAPRVFALPPGVDFPRALVDGLADRATGPDALAGVQLIVNTRRMARRVRDLFDAGPPCLLPQISLVTDLGEAADPADIPPAISPLRRRLQLAQLIRKLLDQQPDLAPRAALYDLADSLAELMDEMQGEGVSPNVISKLDVTDMSGHWARAQAFIGIVQRYFDSDADGLNGQARQRRVTEALVARWADQPPTHPIILAGSTGSRGTTLMLMKAIAQLPQGAVVLPGYDFEQPDAVWERLDEPLLSEDHPQYRFRKLMLDLDIIPADINAWHAAPPPSSARNRIVSLALRPAPVTDAWLSEGPGLTEIDSALADLTLVEASTPRAEALAIALRLRQAAEDGQTAALITPDRMLTRQVSAMLDQWDILPDDSAGTPLHLSPPGRFLRHVAGMLSHRLTGETLLTLLKHPLCHDGATRNEHLLLTRDLELFLRRKGIPFPDAASVTNWAADQNASLAAAWGDWVAKCFSDQLRTEDRPLTDWARDLRTLAEQIAAGSDATGSGGLWDKKAGQEALAIMDRLDAESAFGGDMNAHDFADLFSALLTEGVVRDRDAPHPDIMIWGTLEARVQGADLIILGGLNEGSWPEAPKPDPWLNRALRAQAGLLLPERRIGLSGHDFQQAVAAPEVWLTRAIRSDDAETVAARWINRLTNLLDGLPEQNGPEALADVRKRGAVWLDWAAQLEHAPPLAPAHRPAPRPPVAARPRQLSVTEIKRLIRDPYAIYAKHVLKLKPLNPLVRAPDALLRGILVHEVLESFVRHATEHPDAMTRSVFMQMAQDILSEKVPWPTARVLWIARMDRVADWFLSSEVQRQARAHPIAFEARARATLSDIDFTLTGVADRIDQDDTGGLHIFDYKTGAPPSASEQAKFDKQLLLEAAMAEQSGFKGIRPAPVIRAAFIGLGSKPIEVNAPLDSEPAAKIWAELRELIIAYSDPAQGFTARRMVKKDSDVGDYDQLARFGEWDRTHDPLPEDLT